MSFLSDRIRSHASCSRNGAYVLGTHFRVPATDAIRDWIPVVCCGLSALTMGLRKCSYYPGFEKSTTVSIRRTTAVVQALARTGTGGGDCNHRQR